MSASGSPFSISTDCARWARLGCVDESAVSVVSEGGTVIISISSFGLDGASPSKSDARLLSGDEDR